MSTTASPAPATTPSSTEAFPARLALGALAALWWLPFLLPLAQPPLKHFHAEWLAAMLGIVAFAAIAAARNVRLVLPASAGLLCLLAIYCVLQPLFVPMAYSAPSQSYALYLLWAAAITVAAATLRAARGVEPMLRAIVQAALIGGVLSALLGIVQKYGSPDWLWLLQFDHLQRRSAQGNAGHPNYFGDLLLCALACGAYLFSRLRLSLLVLSIVSMLLAYGITLSGSRGTVLSLIVVSALAAAVWLRAKTAESRRLAGASGLAVAALFCATAVAPTIDTFSRGVSASAEGTVADRIDAADALGTASRRELWSVGLHAALERPLFGHGPDAFAGALFERQREGSLLPYTIHSHNLLLESLLAFGATGTLIVLALLAHLVWQYRARILNPAWWPVTAMTVVLGVRSLLDLPLWFVHFLGIAAVLAGLADNRVRLIGPLTGSTRFALLGAATAAALLLIATLHAYLGMSGIWRQRLPLAQMEARIRNAQKLPFFTAGGDSMRTHLPPLHAAFAPRNLAVNTVSMAWRPHPHVVYRQVALLALNDQEAAACALLERARRVYTRYDEWFETLLTESRTAPDSRLDRIRAAHARVRAGELSPCAVSRASVTAGRKSSQASTVR